MDRRLWRSWQFYPCPFRIAYGYVSRLLLLSGNRWAYGGSPDRKPPGRPRKTLSENRKSFDRNRIFVTTFSRDRLSGRQRKSSEFELIKQSTICELRWNIEVGSRGSFGLAKSWWWNSSHSDQWWYSKPGSVTGIHSYVYISNPNDLWKSDLPAGRGSNYAVACFRFRCGTRRKKVSFPSSRWYSVSGRTPRNCAGCSLFLRTSTAEFEERNARTAFANPGRKRIAQWRTGRTERIPHCFIPGIHYRFGPTGFVLCCSGFVRFYRNRSGGTGAL